MRKTLGIEGLVGDFQTARQYMLEAQCVKPRNQFRLTGQDAFLGVTPRPRPSADLDLESGVVGVGVPAMLSVVTSACRSVRL